MQAYEKKTQIPFILLNKNTVFFSPNGLIYFAYVSDDSNKHKKKSDLLFQIFFLFRNVISKRMRK